MHSLLEQQLEQSFGAQHIFEDPQFRHFLEAVNNSYSEFDIDRDFWEHSLKLSSQAERKYRGIFENALEGIFQCTGDGHLITVNPALARMLGYQNPEQMISEVQNMFSQLLSDEKQRQAYCRQLQEQGIVLGFECLIRRKHNDNIWGSFFTRSTYSPEGKLLYYEGMVLDISERKQLEERFLQSQKMEAFGQLAGGIAHDFNNLLTVIQGSASMVQPGVASEKDYSATLDEISQAAERAANLTRQLLTFSRRSPMQTQDVDLNEIVTGTARMLQRLIGEHIIFEVRYSPVPVSIHADSGMISQVLVNLAVNSRDAMPKGGRLVIETTSVDVEKARPDLSFNALPGNYARLSILDTGCGISSDLLPHIFEPFFTTKAVGKGTGLGLATVFSIVEQHEGWIEVESQIGAGTAFRIYLPQNKNLMPIVKNQAFTTAVSGNECVLLVEDEEPVRKMVGRMLSNNGYKVLEAPTGVAALSIWQEHRSSIDLLMTDVIMPGGLNGVELAQRLVVEKPELKILFCSGYSDDMLGPDSTVRDHLNFVEKPFKMNSLLKHIRECLSEN